MIILISIIGWGGEEFELGGIWGRPKVWVLTIGVLEVYPHWLEEFHNNTTLPKEQVVLSRKNKLKSTGVRGGVHG